MTLAELQKKYADRIRESEPLSKHNTLHVGGTARWYFEAKSADEIRDAVEAAREAGVKIAILGGGSNSLFGDGVFEGLVIRPMLSAIEIRDDGTVRAEAGVISAMLARQTAKAGLTGLEWAVSLPGTVGGAVRGNAGCFGGETKDKLFEVEVLREGKIVTLPSEKCGFAYRESAFKHTTDVILAATFKLERADPAACEQRLNDVLAKRKATQPLGVSSAGCMFKNFTFADESEIAKLSALRSPLPEAFLTKHTIPAGWLIDQAELKGFRVGRASVSDVHGNFLVVEPGATADEIIQLVAALKTKVRNQFGISLEEEVQWFL